MRTLFETFASYLLLIANYLKFFDAFNYNSKLLIPLVQVTTFQYALSRENKKYPTKEGF
jgi:hypothetical protein